MLVQFLLYGLLGWGLEITWTGLGSLLLPPTNWRLPGRTYLWMFPLYGGAALLLQPLVPALAAYHWAVRGIAWAGIIYVLEFSSGELLRRGTGVCPWDYSGAWFNFRGVIRWDYAPLWFVLGLAFERLSHVVNLLTPGITDVLVRTLSGVG